MFLLDTCCLIWLNATEPPLSAAARMAIQTNPGRLFVSSISAFEIAIKCAKHKLTLPSAPENWFADTLKVRGLAEITIDWQAAMRSARLPPIHSDPCDRIIIATAQLRNLTIISPDPLIKAYPGTATLW